MREDRLGMHVMAEKTGIAQRWVIADAVEFAVNGGGGGNSNGPGLQKTGVLRLETAKCRS